MGNGRITSNTMDKRKRTKRQTMIYKTLYRKLQNEQRKPHSGAPEGYAIPRPRRR